MQIEEWENGTLHVVLDGTETVKSCPFCDGQDIKLHHTWTAIYSMCCTDCGAEMHGDYGGDLLPSRKMPNFEQACHLASAEDALARWNSRPEAIHITPISRLSA